MTKRPLQLFIALLMVAPIGCKQPEYLPAPKLEAVLYDLSIAEAYSTKSKDNANFGGVKDLDTLAGYYKDVLAHHHITSAQFTESLDWYKSRPDDIDSIYAHISTKADKENAEDTRQSRLNQGKP